MKAIKLICLAAFFSVIIGCTATTSTKKSEPDIPPQTDPLQEITIKNGKVELFWSNKNIRCTGEMHNGEKNGQWRWYDKQGKIIKNEKFVYGDLRERMLFYSNGVPHFHIFYKNGKRHGKFSEYDQDGKPIEIAWYTDGIKNGQTNLYFKNGKKKAIGIYKNGKKNGRWKYYHTNGMPESTGYYRDNEKIGIWIYYDENGQKIQEKPHS